MTLSRPDGLAVVTEVPSDRAAIDSQPSGLRRLSVGLLLVYVAILAINSGGLGILIPNLVADIDE